MDTSLQRNVQLTLNFDAGQVSGLVLIALFGCIAGALVNWDHRRTYRLSGSMPSDNDFLRPLLRSSAVLVIWLFYIVWVRDWIKPLAANFMFVLAGGIAYVLAFSPAYWLTDLELRYPEPLPVPYRFVKEELSPRPPLRSRIHWPLYFVLSLSMEILERKVFGDYQVVRSILNIAGTLLLAVTLLAGIFLSRPYHLAWDQLRKEIKNREALAAMSSPIALP